MEAKVVHLSDLDIEGLGFDDVDFDESEFIDVDGSGFKKTKNRKNSATKAIKSTTPKRQRKSVSLTFSDNSKPYGTALSYWMERGLATPLIWAVIDELAAKMDDQDKSQFSEEKLIEFINSTSSEDIAKSILKKLKS